MVKQPIRVPAMAGNENADASATERSMATIVGAVFIILALIATALRFYARFKRAGLWWDDWSALAAALAAVAAGVLVLASALVDPDADWLLSVTDPNYNYTPANQLDLKLGWIAEILYFTVVGAAKASLLLMYTRIFSVSTNFRTQVWIQGVAVATCWAVGTIGTIFNCWPIYWTWLVNINPAEHCMNYNIFWLVLGIAEEIIDVCILALPIQHILKLQLSLQKKIGVASIFLLGGLLPVCWPILARGAAFLHVSGLSNLTASGKVRSWWQTYRRGRGGSRSWFSGGRTKERKGGELPSPAGNSAESVLPRAEEVAAAEAKYSGYAGPSPPPPPPAAAAPPPSPGENCIRVDTSVDVAYPPQVQYIWDTSRISGQEYQQHYGNVPQVVAGDGAGGPYVAQYHVVQDADGRVHWAWGNPV
ncbi:hypothetical protein SLS63_011590 [Diaporthe eres]|uniref:Rhodopsin domain-containing protein n=1 Tax=Diaporthe eres TaxID=83184 RepID=A0ABR1NTL2_DIAER